MSDNRRPNPASSTREILRRQYRAIFPQSGVWQYNRLPLYSEKLPFLVLWSQKAASTNVLKWFFHHIGLLETALQYRRFAHHYENDIFKRAPGYVRSVRAAIDNKNIDAVKFVRDPAARAFSSYLFLNRPLLFEPTDDLGFYWRRRVLRFIHGRNCPLDALFSFTDFLVWLNEAAPRHIDGHLARQYTTIEDRVAGRMKIFQIEAFDEATRSIEERYALPVTPRDQMQKIQSATHHNDKNAGADTLDRIIHEGLPNRETNPLPLPVFDTQTMRDYPRVAELIRAYFADDYCAYGY